MHISTEALTVNATLILANTLVKHISSPLFEENYFTLEKKSLARDIEIESGFCKNRIYFFYFRLINSVKYYLFFR